MDNNDDDSVITIEGFKFCRLDRTTGMEHGGILCYVRDGIVFTEKSDLYNDNVEALWIEINLPQTKPLLLGTVYRAPDSKAEYIDKLDFLFQNCTSLYDDVVIVGDFNLDLCKTSNNTKVNKLASHCNMKQLINDYTRITETSKTILDLAFVTNPNRVSDSGVRSCGLSDHSLIYLVREKKKNQVPSKTIKYRSMRNLMIMNLSILLKIKTGLWF